jgi:hypothetical protein
MTTDHQMVMMYATQQQVIVAVADVGKADLADPSGTLHDSTARTARRRWLAVHLPIRCMCLVPSTDGPFKVEWHVPMVGRSN